MSVPGADELFRHTGVPEQAPDEQPAPQAPRQTTGRSGSRAEAPVAPAVEPAPVAEPASTGRTSSGRVRHDEKMTVYVTADELLDLEHARLVLRRLGISVDRGRLVREAVALALADLEDRGRDSVLADRLTAG